MFHDHIDMAGDNMQPKEIKSVRVVPYTIMNSSLGAVWAFLFALLILIFAGAIGSVLPAEMKVLKGLITGISVVGLVVLPVGAFLLGIVESFLRAFIYNGLTPRLGGIRLSFIDMEKIESFEIVNTALILSAVSAILTLIYQLLVSPFSGYSSTQSSALQGLLNHQQHQAWPQLDLQRHLVPSSTSS